MRRLIISLVLFVTMAVPAPGLAQTFASPGFEALWAATDAPVAAGGISRAWVWGPGPITEARHEPYAEAPGGTRLVQYFDKGRMEQQIPGGPVTSGLLARELITGAVQTGDRRLEARAPAGLGLVGDPDDTLGPTYASFARLLDRPPLELGAPLVEVVDREAGIGIELALARYGARADVFVPETGHRVASVFRAYFEGRPLPNSEGETPPAAPFAPWYSVTGLPISEAYWTRARVGTIVRDVLVQAFERRVLTYTPANPPGSRIEMGNVGRHYLAWLAGAGAPPPATGLPCPAVAEPPPAGRRESNYVLLGSALHEIGSRRVITGAVRNDGPTSGAVEVLALRIDANRAVVGRHSAFTDRDIWPNGQVAAFQIDLPPDPAPADWAINIRAPNDRPTGGLAGGFRIESLSGNVGGAGVGEVAGTLRYDGAEPFMDIAVVRVQALDACGSVVGRGFTPIDQRAILPGSVIPFTALLVNAEGAVQVRAVVEARVGTSALIHDDALRVYEGSLYPAPRVPIVSVDGCCQYTRAYERPDGTRVRSIYRLTTGPAD